MAHIPDYMQVRQYLMGMIYAQKDIAQRLPTERELSEKLGVSRISVRYAVRELIEHELIEVKPPKGMFINPKAIWNPLGKQRKTYKIMTIWGNGQMLTIDGFYMGIMEKLCSVMKHKPAVLQTVSFIGWEEKLASEIRMYNPDGIFWVRPNNNCYEIIRNTEWTYPVCVFGDVPQEDLFSYGIDFYHAGSEAAKWMIKRGCLYPIYAGMIHETSRATVDYFKGWKETLSKAGYTRVDEFKIYDADNVQEKLYSLLKSGADGIFSLGSNWFEVHDVLSESRNNKIPLLLEDNGALNGFFDVEPDAKMEICPGVFVEKAAEALFKQLENPCRKPVSKIYLPVIINLKSKRS